MEGHHIWGGRDGQEGVVVGRMQKYAWYRIYVTERMFIYQEEETFGS